MSKSITLRLKEEYWAMYDMEGYATQLLLDFHVSSKVDNENHELIIGGCSSEKLDNCRRYLKGDEELCTFFEVDYGEVESARV